jgi:hypothetical protein
VTTGHPQRRGGPDLLAPLLDLPGVADAAEAARTALGKAHRHRTNLRNWPVTAAESAVRGARCSSALDGGGVQLQSEAAGSDDPWLQSKGALARLYASQVLSGAPGLADAVMEGAGDLESVEAAMLAG